MGSYNVKCQVSGYTIGLGDPMVGFFVKPAPEQSDGSHQPDAPLRSLFQQQIPVHLPVEGEYGDYGFLLAKDPLSAGVQHAKSRLAGYDFSATQSFNLGGEGLDPGLDGPVKRRWSTLHLWQVRKDVYDQLLKLGRSHPKALSDASRKVISDAYQGIDPNNAHYKDAVALFTGLEVMGHAFRKTVDMPDEAGERDNEIRLSMHKALLTDKTTGDRRPAALPGGALLSCGLTGRPILENEPVLILPLIATKLVHTNSQESSGPLRFVTDHSANSHYELVEGSISAHIDDQGAVVVEGQDVVEARGMSEKMLRLLRGYTEEDTGNKISSMVISEQAYAAAREFSMAEKEPFVNDGKSLTEALAHDFGHVETLLKAAQDAFMSQNLERLEAFLETQGLADTMESVRSRDGYNFEKLSQIVFMRFSDSLRRLQDTDSEYGRLNLFSDVADHSHSLLHIKSIMRLNKEIQDFVLKGEGSIGSILGRAVESVILKNTLERLGTGLNATEPRQLQVDPKVALKAWSDLHSAIYGPVNRQVIAYKKGMDYDY